MHHMREMISSHPSVQGNTNDALISCIEECYSCAQSCTSCADACVAEEMVDQLRQCIRLNLDCADIRSEEHTSELQSLMRISYAVFCLNKQIHTTHTDLHLSHPP